MFETPTVKRERGISDIFRGLESVEDKIAEYQFDRSLH